MEVKRAFLIMKIVGATRATVRTGTGVTMRFLYMEVFPATAALVFRSSTTVVETSSMLTAIMSPSTSGCSACYKSQCKHKSKKCKCKA